MGDEHLVFDLLRLAAFIAFALGSVVEDIRSYRVRPLEIAIGILVVIGIRLGQHDRAWVEIIAGGSAGASLLWVIWRCSKRRLGAGDVWFSSFIGFSFGFTAWDLSMLIAAFSGLAWALLKYTRHRCERFSGMRIPFAPFMFAGAVVVAIAGEFS